MTYRYEGEVRRSRSRRTGTAVVLIDAQRGGDWLDGGGARWITFCDDHGTCVGHETRELAESFLPYPDEFCADCTAIVDGCPTCAAPRSFDDPADCPTCAGTRLAP